MFGQSASDARDLGAVIALAGRAIASALRSAPPPAADEHALTRRERGSTTARIWSVRMALVPLSSSGTTSPDVSYSSAMRIQDLADRGGVESAGGVSAGPSSRHWAGRVRLQPLPRQGRTCGATWSGKCAARLAGARPARTPFPRHLLAARVALVGEPAGCSRPSRERFSAQSSPRAPRSPIPRHRTSCRPSVEPEECWPRQEASDQVGSPPADGRAQARLFGAPSFVTPDGELFWGTIV
jgi:hypothetical protein